MYSSHYIKDSKGRKRLHDMLYEGSKGADNVVVSKSLERLFPFVFVKGVAKAPIASIWTGVQTVIHSHPDYSACNIDLTAVMCALGIKYVPLKKRRKVLSRTEFFSLAMEDIGFISAIAVVVIMKNFNIACDLDSIVREIYLRHINIALVGRMGRSLLHESLPELLDFEHNKISGVIERCLGDDFESYVGDIISEGFDVTFGIDPLGYITLLMTSTNILYLVGDIIEYLSKNDEDGQEDYPGECFSILRILATRQVIELHSCKHRIGIAELIEDLDCVQLSDHCIDKDLNVIKYYMMNGECYISLIDLIVRASVYRARMERPNLHSSERKALRKLYNVCENIDFCDRELKDMIMEVNSAHIVLCDKRGDGV